MFIYGSISFSNKKERKAAWKQLKQEFAEYGDKLRIIIQDGIMTYSIKVDRNFI